MKTPSSSTAGARRSAASRRSFSRHRVSSGGGEVRGWGSATTVVALPEPPAIGFFTDESGPGSGLVDLLELTLGPLGRILGLHALGGLRVHVDHHVLRERLGGLARRRAGVAEDLRGAGR